MCAVLLVQGLSNRKAQSLNMIAKPVGITLAVGFVLFLFAGHHCYMVLALTICVCGLFFGQYLSKYVGAQIPVLVVVVVVVV